MRRSILPVSLAIAAIGAVIVYWRTAFPSISWWENGELAAAASVLGVVHPPGSLIPTIAGWLFLKIPLGFSPAFQLNVLAGVIAASVVALILLLGLRVGRSIRMNAMRDGFAVAIAVFFAGMTCALCRTIWYNGTIFTPYIFTACMTALILYALWCWWETARMPESFKWMFLIFLLIGLDFSVHRTNALLIPGLGIAFLIRHWRTAFFRRAWVAGISGLGLGLVFHLVTMALALANPVINANDPSSFSRFWDYVTLKQYGGGFLVSLSPRNGDFWDVQVADYMNGFLTNFANTQGLPWLLKFIAFLPIVVGIFGLVSLIRHNWRFGMSMLILFLCASLGAIAYFNVPANYFRAMDRHYLPSFVIFGVFLVYGTLTAVRWAQSWPSGKMVAPIMAVVFAIMPLTQALGNPDLVNNAHNTAAYATGENILNSVPDNAILFVASDVDTYPLWYLQTAEQQRPDVTVLNVSLLNTSWYVRQMQERDPRIGTRMSDEEIDGLSAAPWTDTTIVIPLAGTFLTPDSMPLDSARVHFPPTLEEQYVMPQDILIRRILVGNAWRRPVYATTFVFGQVSWLLPYSRSEGLVRQIMPYEGAPPEIEIINSRMLETYDVSFFTTSWRLDPTTQVVGRAMWGEYLNVLAATENIDSRWGMYTKFNERVPFERLNPDSQLTGALQSLQAFPPPPDGI